MAERESFPKYDPITDLGALLSNHGQGLPPSPLPPSPPPQDWESMGRCNPAIPIFSRCGFFPFSSSSCQARSMLPPPGSVRLFFFPLQIRFRKLLAHLISIFEHPVMVH